MQRPICLPKPWNNLDERKRERPFPFQRASCNFSALMANWQLYREGKKTRRSNRLFNGCRNCGHKHSGELALPKAQERLCNVSHEKVDEAAYLLVPFKGLKEWEKMRKTREHKKTEPPWTLLVNGARLFRFTSAFCSMAKLSHVVRMCCPLFGNQKCLLLLWIFIASLQFFISAVRKGGGGSGVSGERAPPETPPPTANLAHVLQPPPAPVMWPPASLLPTSRRPTGISHSCRHIHPHTVALCVTNLCRCFCGHLGFVN